MAWRSMAVAVVTAAAAVTAGVFGLTNARAQEDRRVASGGEAGGYAVVVPRLAYQTIVISPEGVPGDLLPLRFTIRTREPSGVVSDFPVFVRRGELATLTFPQGWAPTGDSFLLAQRDVRFAAWGVEMSRSREGTPGPGPLVRFVPVERDPQRDAADREREREFEALLREAERNR